MIVEQRHWNCEQWNAGASKLGASAELALIVGSTRSIQREDLIEQVRTWYPKAYLPGCFTAGEIVCRHVHDDTLAVTACAFEHTKLKTAEIDLAQVPDSFPAGAQRLISCVGRKLVLKQRVEEEIDAVTAVLGGAAITGFYSYGEISPFTPSARCEQHNQSMTITTLREV